VNPDSTEAKEIDDPLLKDLLVRATAGNIMVQVQAEDPSRIRELLPFLKKIGQEFPGMGVTSYQLSLFPGSSRKIDLELTGPDMESLVPLARRVQEDIKRAIPNVQTSAVPDLSITNPELHVWPNWERTASLGTDATELGYAVDVLVDGAYATDYSIGGEKVDLRILSNNPVDLTQNFDTVPIAVGKAGVVPISSLADVKIGTGPTAIRRIERRRAITIEVRPPADIPLGEAIEILQADVIQPLRKSDAMTNGLQANLGGTADRLVEAWVAMRFNLILALAITYLLMAALFESWVYPFVIILSVPLAAVGGFLGLWLMNQFTNQPLDIITMLGFVILIGTSVNNAILIVHQSLNHIREENMHPQQAVLESVRTRIRPIFMTTGTTIMGLFPLVLMPGAGSELYRGLGSVVLGGLVVSTMLTLIIVPSFFSLVMDAKTGWTALSPGKNVPEQETEQPEVESMTNV
jgi:hydrophobic/amphiphilic exporter-1 (mainly G- bacteria), HAE1 family